MRGDALKTALLGLVLLTERRVSGAQQPRLWISSGVLATVRTRAFGQVEGPTDAQELRVCFLSSDFWQGVHGDAQKTDGRATSVCASARSSIIWFPSFGVFLVFALLARALVGRAREDIVLRATGAIWLYFICFLYCFSSSFRLIYYSVILVRVHYTPTPFITYFVFNG